MAFQDYKVAVPVVNWVGFDNFADVLYNSEFWYSLWLSFYYSFLVILLTWLPPLVLALMLDEVPRLSVLFRVLFYLPALISGLVVIFLWKHENLSLPRDTVWKTISRDFLILPPH